MMERTAMPICLRILISVLFAGCLLAQPPGFFGSVPVTSGGVAPTILSACLTTGALNSTCAGPANPPQSAGGSTAAAINTTGVKWIGIAIVKANGGGVGSVSISDCVNTTNTCGSSTNSYTCEAQVNGGSSPSVVFCYNASPTVGAAHWFSVTGGGNYPAFYVYPMTGVVSGAYNTDQVTNTSPGSSPFLVGSAGGTTPAAGAAMQFFICGNQNIVTSVTVTSPSLSATPYLLDINPSGFGFESGYLNQSTSASEQFHITLGSYNETTACLALSFKG